MGWIINRASRLRLRLEANDNGRLSISIWQSYKRFIVLDFVSGRARLAILDLKAVVAAAVFVRLDAHVQLLRRLIFVQLLKRLILISTAPGQTVLVLPDFTTFLLILVLLVLVVASLIVAPCGSILKISLKFTYFDWHDVKR